MSTRRRYRRKPDQTVVAVQLNLDTDGFSYRKWGGEQRCKQNDWIVQNGSNVHTVDAEVFARTYRQIHCGVFIKTTPIWAEVATRDGSVVTKEGRTRYSKGDYLVSNNEDGSDAYATSAQKFLATYEPDG